MRIWDNLPPYFQNFAVILWVIGLALNFITAISSTWGWHPFLGWGATLVLMVIAYDEKKWILRALMRRQGTIDRLFAIYLLSISTVALMVNVILAIKK